MGKLERNGPLGNRRQEDNIKMNFRKYNWGNMAQDRGQWWAFVKTAMNVTVLYNLVKFLGS